MSRAGWNEPLDIRPSKTERTWDGEVWRERIDWVLCEEDLQLVREGRKCIWCLEVFRSSDGSSIAWPVACPVCEYPVAARQAEALSSEYMGHVKLGPESSDADEVERLTERTERRIWTPGSSVPILRDI